MKVLFAGSGSKGNATLFLSGDTLIQIDAGISRLRINKGLESFSKSTDDLSAIFITHNHNDHIKELEIVSRGKDVYASCGCLLRDYHIIEPGEGIEIGPFTIIPFSSSHDAPNPLNFIILSEGMKIGYVTDTGEILNEGLSLLENCDYYLFESNYEPSMLAESPRPAWLKRRIKGRHGHLSNLQACRYIKQLAGDRTKGIFLAHLSEECNAPEAALKRMKNTIAKMKKEDQIFVEALPQWEHLIQELHP